MLEIEMVATDDALAYANCRSIRELRAFLRSSKAPSRFFNVAATAPELALYNATFRRVVDHFISEILGQTAE